MSSPASRQRLRRRTMLHAGNSAHVLPPIPEAQEPVPPGRADGKPDWERGPAPFDERTNSNLSAAATPLSSLPVESAADTDEGTELAAVCIYPWDASVREWPAGREARGRITLRASADPQAEGTRAVCTVCDGVLTLAIEQRSAASDRRTESTVAEVPVEALAVGLPRGCDDTFTVGTVHNNRVYDEIYCSTDQSKRDKWIMVFRRMGVTVYRLPDRTH